MTDREQIEEMAKDLPFLTLEREVYVSFDVKEKHAWTLSEEDNKQIAQELVKASYHKTIWHKVADGDLPPANTDIIFYAYMSSGTCYYDMGVYSHIEKLWYGNLCSTTNDRVIAWTELPEYKE